MNIPLRIGKLSFIHGAYATMNHAKKHAEIYGNLVYGHTHDVTSYAMGRLDGTVKAWSLGNLKDLTPGKNAWLRGRIHNWQHAVGHVTWFLPLNQAFFPGVKSFRFPKLQALTVPSNLPIA
jgi:hypothetical protein